MDDLLGFLSFEVEGESSGVGPLVTRARIMVGGDGTPRPGCPRTKAPRVDGEQIFDRGVRALTAGDRVFGEHRGRNGVPLCLIGREKACQ